MTTYLAPALLGGLTAVMIAAAAQPLAASSLGAATRARAFVVAGAVLAVWFATTFALTHAGTFEQSPGSVPVIGVAIAGPVLLFLGLLAVSPAVRRVAGALDQRALIAFQTLRVIGGIFVVLWFTAELPWEFAVPAGFGDVAVGLLALYALGRIARAPGGQNRWARRVVVAGMADFVLAIGTGVATAPGVFQVLSLDQPNALINTHPLALIPAFAVPLFMIGHILAWRLARARPEPAPAVPAGVRP